jgi:hypothetical protein
VTAPAADAPLLSRQLQREQEQFGLNGYPLIGNAGRPSRLEPQRTRLDQVREALRSARFGCWCGAGPGVLGAVASVRRRAVPGRCGLPG